MAVTGVEGDLQLDNGNKAAIPEDKEESPGAIVLLNDDDDDEDGVADLTDDKRNGDEIEDFHRVAIMKKPALTGKGKFVLSFNSPSIKVRDAKGTLIVSEVTEFDVAKDTVLYVEGIDFSGFLGEEKLFVKFKPKDGGALTKSLDEVRYTVAKLDLAASTVGGDGPVNEPGDDLSELKEESRGAYVPFNDDIDAYAKTPAGTLRPDHAVDGAIEFENDLLRLTVLTRQIDIGGEITPMFGNNIRLWENRDRSGPIASNAVTTKDEFWVEGFKEKGVDRVAVQWTNDVQVIKSADAVNIHVFHVGGPLNVPDHSKHEYIAIGGAKEGRSGWLNTDTAIATLDNRPATTDFAQYFWQDGARVGFATYQADEDFIWEIDVNIVDVKLIINAEAAGFNQITYANPPRGNPIERNRIDSTADALAMQNHVAVSITGPVDGKRGTEFIEVGIMQLASIASGKWRTTRDSDDLTMVSRFEDKTFIDQISNEATSTYPWYDSTNVTRDRRLAGSQGAFLAGEVLPESGVVLLSTGDRPTLPISRAPFEFEATTTFIIDFPLFVAARTSDKTHGGEEPTRIYTSQATAGWHFNGSGTFAADGTFTPAVGQGAGNSGTSFFQEDTSGMDIPTPRGGNANTQWRKHGGFVPDPGNEF